MGVQHSLNKNVQTCFEQLVVDTNSARMFGRRQGILDNVFNEDVDVDLLESIPHRPRLDIGQHDKLDIGGGLVVMQLVLRGTVGNETAFCQSL